MSTSMIGAAGGLSAADREKLVPENLREGVTLFEGTSKEVVGSLIPFDEFDVLACTASIYRTGPSCVSYWNGTSMAYAFASQAITISGTPVIAIMNMNTGVACDICGLSSVGQKTEGLTKRIWVTDSFIDGKIISYVVLGKR